jgi:hypothetical protein
MFEEPRALCGGEAFYDTLDLLGFVEIGDVHGLPIV